jgi:hypothetical protein
MHVSACVNYQHSVTGDLLSAFGYKWFIISVRLQVIYYQRSVTSDLLSAFGYKWFIISVRLQVIYYPRLVTSDLLSAFGYKWFIFDIQNAGVVTLFIIGNFDIFPLISLSDIASINLVTLILETIGQCGITLWHLIPI